MSSAEENFHPFMEDLTQLHQADTKTISDLVCARYEQKKSHYTQIGRSDLLALSTNERLSDQQPLISFLSSADHSIAHIYATASQTLNDVDGIGKEAAIVFCGEAGAGKTTHLFHSLRFLAFAEERRREGLGGNNGQRTKAVRNLVSVNVVNALELILAAFGAAKTVKNDHSTMHGYAIELHYRGKALDGLCFMDSFVLLDLSRIIGQRKGECNFDIFYQLCDGINATQREKLGLIGADKYFYLNQGNCRHGNRQTDFAKLVDALAQVGFSDHQRELIMRLLAAILHIGNLFFMPQRADNGAEIANETELRWAAVLLQTEFDQLKKTFTLSDKDERLTVEAALDMRDAFAKTLYDGLFRWILSRISMFLRPASPKESTAEFAGATRGKIILLDVPGSRRYNNNGYDELCINLLNERLELFFQQRRFGQFSDDQLQYVFASRTGDLGQRQWPSNERIMEMLVKRPMGILPLLDDECKFPRGTDETFLQHCNINHLDNAIYAKARVKGRLEFGIHHQFGLSFYSVDGFLAKNRFLQPTSIFAVLSDSEDTSVASIFDELGENRTADRWMYAANEWHNCIVKLCEQLKSFRLHFVRCVRTEMADGKLNQKLIQRQLRLLSVSDHCLAVRDGFQHKIPIKKFADCFRALLPDEVIRGQNAHQIAKDVLDAQGIRCSGQFEFVSGHVFLMETLFARLSGLKQSTLNMAALVIQRNFRKFLARRHFLLKRAAAIQIQATFRGWKCRKRWKRMALTERRMKTFVEGMRGKREDGREREEDEEEEEDGMMIVGMEEEVQRQLSSLLKSMDFRWRDKSEQIKWTQFREGADYVRSAANAKSTDSVTTPTMTFERFAAEKIKAMPIGARREPIVAPFLPKDSEEEFVQSLNLFKLILGHQFQPESTDLCRLVVSAKAIVRHGILFPSLRDELFLQLINQTHKSISKMALDRAWTLLLCAINAFPPADDILVLLHGIFQAQPLSPLSKMLSAELLKTHCSPQNVCLAAVRNFGPSLLEYQAFVQRRPFTLLAQFVTGEALFLEMDARKTAEEAVQTMLRQRGIGDSFGWSLELDDGIRCTRIHSSLFLFDAIAQIEEKRHIFSDKFGTEPPLFVFLHSPKSFIGEKFGRINKENNGGPICEIVEKRQNWQNETVRTNWADLRNGNGAIAQLPKNLPNNAFSGPTLARMERPFHRPAAVHVRLDEAVQLRRSSNMNCMSRITEREEEDGTSTANGTEMTETMQRRHKNHSREEGTLGLIRNMPVPTSDGGVDRFLDDVFERALPPVDYDLEDNNTDDAENELPSREETTTNWESARTKLREQWTECQQNGDNWQMPKRFVYRAGGGIFVEKRNEAEAQDLPEINVRRAKVQSQQLNDERIGDERLQMPNGARNRLAQPTATMLREMANVGFGIETPSRPISLGNRPAEENRYEETFNSNWRQFVPMKRHFDNELNTEEETETLTDDDVTLEMLSEDAVLTNSSANEWVTDSEFTLDNLLFNSRHQPTRGTFSTGEKSHSSLSRMPKVRQFAKFNSEPHFTACTKKVEKCATALSYSEQPFSLVLCRDLFMPGEVLDDALEIDLIFEQIIRDCRRQLCQPRIRRYERESVQQLLRSFNVPPKALDKPATIPTNVKLELIEIVRKWPLYFCRLFPVVEERPSERFPQLLGISESGIRLISVHSNPNQTDEEVKMTIQDHFDWCDIAELVLENSENALRIVTRQNIAILISGQQMPTVKRLIESFVIGGKKRRHFVVALSTYSTREPNVLSFEQGDYIQLIDCPDSQMPSTGDQWLFGRLDGCFGWLPAEYVLDAELGEEQRREHCSDGGGDGSTVDAFSTPEGSFRECVGGFDYPFAAGIPPALQTLFVSIDPQLLFLPTNSGADRFTLLEFAHHFFRRQKSNASKIGRSDALNGGDWPYWKELADRIKFSDRPIAHSLLRLESHEADRVAQQSFLVIMRFMGDEPLKRHQSFTDCVYELLSLCHIYVPIRDEVYCQILKQITENRSEKCADSSIRGWRLLSILCAYFECSEAFKPFLVKFIGDVAFNARRNFNEIAKISLYNLAQTYRFGGRRLILSASEVEAITNGRNVRRQWYHLPGGHRRLIDTRPVTVAEEIVSSLCLEMNIRSVAEQQEFSLCYILLKDNSVHTLLNDEYVLDICTELETRGDDFLMILTRSVWLHPIRRESDMCTDALFFQLLPNYLAGLPISLRQDGSATAAVLEDMAMIGALLVLSAHQNNAKKNDVSNLVPKNVLGSSNGINISHEKWLQRINARVQTLNSSNSTCSTPAKARQQFLEIIERWPLFGAAFYFVRRVYSGKNNANSVPGAMLLAENCVLAVNKFGLRVLSSGTHHILAEFELERIREMSKYSISDTIFFEIRFAAFHTNENGYQSNCVTVETDLGNEISRLIGHYIFLSKGSATEERIKCVK